MMKKLIALILAVLTGMTGFAGVALAERDWSQFIAVPTEDQLSQPGAYRSPYITFLPSFDPQGSTACAMDFRIDFDPEGTYICPACWNMNTSQMEEDYVRVWSDYGELISGYFGFQALENGEKVVIMSLWDAFCEDEAGNVTVIKPQINNSEGIEEYEGSWNFGRDDDACWIITSGVPGLCKSPEKLTGYEIPATENGAPN